MQDFPSLVDLTDELGVVGGRYDFQAQDIRKKQAAYQKAQQAKNEKECSVNKQVCPLLPAEATALSGEPVQQIDCCRVDFPMQRSTHPTV